MITSSNKEERTEQCHTWLKSLSDEDKLHFATNWKMPHSIFNIACKKYKGGYKNLQNIDFYKIYKSKDMGNWSHGGKVICQYHY